MSVAFPFVALVTLCMYANLSFGSSQTTDMAAPLLDALYQVEQFGVRLTVS